MMTTRVLPVRKTLLPVELVKTENNATTGNLQETYSISRNACSTDCGETNVVFLND